MSRHKPLPFIRFYVDDYMADTAHLTTCEHGAYSLILWNYWRRQEAPDEGKIQRIAKLSDSEFKVMRDTLAEFFQINDGVWKHKRIELELRRVREDVLLKKRAGKASGKARRNRAGNEQNATDVEQALNTRSTNAEQVIRSNGFPAVIVPIPDEKPKKHPEKPSCKKPLNLGAETEAIMQAKEAEWARAAGNNWSREHPANVVGLNSKQGGDS